MSEVHNHNHCKEHNNHNHNHHCDDNNHTHEKNHGNCCEHNHTHEHEHGSGCCGHCHSDHSHGSETTKSEFVLYFIGIILFFVSIFLVPEKFKIITFGVSIVFVGIDILINGVKNIFKLNFDETTLMAIAVIAAFVLGEYTESAMVLILSKFGEFLEDKTLERSNKSIHEISEIKEEKANLINDNGNIEVVDADKVNVGNTILIKPGERIPLDSIIIEGETKIDSSVITGESNLREVKSGEQVLSGSINIKSAITCRVEKKLEDSTASQIVELVNEATHNKGKTENLITKFSKIYTPIVMIIALLIAIVPASLGFLTYKVWIKRSLIFLVASCPCSIVISIPLALFAGVGSMAKRGLLVKGTKHIEDLSKASTICFDKTGTLTTGKKEIDKLKIQENVDKEEAIKYMISLESLSNHPVSYAILKLKESDEREKVEEYQEIAGKGVVGYIKGHEVLLGNEKLLKEYNVECNNTEYSMHLSVDKKVWADISLREEIEECNKNIVKKFEKYGIRDIVMLTGDNRKEAEKIADELKIKKVYSELLPADKQNKIVELKKNNKVVFVGDGINDGPVLATSNFGISMGKGTEIANNVSDGILISNKISIIPECIKDAKKTMGIVKFNIGFSLVVKFAVLALGVVGVAPMWSAVIADTGVSAITILNAVRVYKK